MSTFKSEYTVLTPLQAKDFLDRLEKKECRMCRTPFSNIHIEGYISACGWYIKNSTDMMWLFITCKRCGYQNSLWKLGIPEDNPEAMK